MDRAEFMNRLTAVLNDVPPAEREEAIQYYNDYFDDAGAENEASVIDSLGTPEELAKVIKAGLNDGGSVGEFTETGFAGYGSAHKDEVMKRQADAGQNQQETQGGAENSNTAWQSGAENSNTAWQGDANQQSTSQNQQNAPQGSAEQKAQKKGMSGGMIALVIIALVLGSPIWIGALGALFGGALGIFGGLLGVFVAFLVVGIVLAAVGIALIVAGIVALVPTPLGGLCMIGGGLIVTAVGLVFIWLMVLVVGTAIPALIRGIVNLCQKLFHRGGAKA